MLYYDAITGTYKEMPEQTALSQAMAGYAPEVTQLGTDAGTTATGLITDTNVPGDITPNVIQMSPLPPPGPVDSVPLNISPEVQQAIMNKANPKKEPVKPPVKPVETTKGKDKRGIDWAMLLGEVLTRGGDITARKEGRSDPFLQAAKTTTLENDPASDISRQAQDILTRLMPGKDFSQTSYTTAKKTFPMVQSLLGEQARQQQLSMQKLAMTQKKEKKKEISAKDKVLAQQGLYSVNQLDNRLRTPQSWVNMQKTIGASKIGLLASQEGRKLRGEMRNAVDVILRFRTGARINKDEFDQAMEAWGIQIGDSYSTVKKKIADLRNMYDLMLGKITPESPQYKNAIAITDNFVNQAKSMGVIGEQTKRPKKEIVRTGTKDGRKVVQYSDGSIEYAN